jgi:coenzyme PQQ precursor peptide PqqA
MRGGRAELAVKSAERILAVPCSFGSIIFPNETEDSMAWTTPVLVEICIGLEINGYMPADGYVPPEF